MLDPLAYLRNIASNIDAIVNNHVGRYVASEACTASTTCWHNMLDEMLGGMLASFDQRLSLKAGANGSNMLDTTCWMLDATCWNRLFAYFLFINFFLFGTRKFDFFFIINTLLASFFLCKMDEHEVVNVDEVES